MIGQIAAADTYCMNFLYVFGYGHKARDGTERLAEIVGVKAGYDNPDALVREFLYGFDEGIVEKLGFVYAYDLDVRLQKGDHARRGLYRGAGDAVEVVRDDVEVGVTLIHRRLENSDFLLGELGPFEPADKFLRLSREHRAANYLDASSFFCIF